MDTLHYAPGLLGEVLDCLYRRRLLRLLHGCLSFKFLSLPRDYLRILVKRFYLPFLSAGRSVSSAGIQGSKKDVVGGWISTRMWGGWCMVGVLGGIAILIALANPLMLSEVSDAVTSITLIR